MNSPVPEVVYRVPLWSHSSIDDTSWIPGGITNRNLRVTARGESFVVRIPGRESEVLGIDRRRELAAHSAAARIGIAPEVVYFVEPEGCLVTRFLHAKPLPTGEIRSPENLRRVAQCLRRIHEMPAIPGSFSSFRTVRRYASTCRERGIALPVEFDSLSRAAAGAERVLERPTRPLRPCHNDLLNENFLDDGAIRILDWEYAAMGDRFFDLGNFSANHDLDDTEDQLLLEAYFASPIPSGESRLKVMRVMSHLREAMWGMVQISLSQLEFDFASYARRHFAKATEGIRHPRWEQWLERAGYDA